MVETLVCPSFVTVFVLLQMATRYMQSNFMQRCCRASRLEVARRQSCAHHRQLRTHKFSKECSMGTHPATSFHIPGWLFDRETLKAQAKRMPQTAGHADDNCVVFVDSHAQGESDVLWQAQVRSLCLMHCVRAGSERCERLQWEGTFN